MRLVFLKVGWMKEYKGANEHDNIEYGKMGWDNSHDELEQYNFLQKNEYCYGYVSTRDTNGEYEELHIEKLDGISKHDDTADDVLAVWISTACDDTNEVRVIGWYKDAALYRMYQNIGLAFYNVKAKAKNCMLLPIDMRDFVLKITKPGNVLFRSDFQNQEAIEDVLNYINTFNGERLNFVITEDDLFRESLETLDTGEDYLEKAEMLYEEKRTLEALHLCNSALKYGCLDADVYNLKGLILYELYQYNESMKCYSEALEIYPDFYEVFYNMALVHEENKDFESAIKSYEKYMEYCPESPEGYSGKGQVYIQLQEYENALECFNKAISYGTVDIDAYAFQAIALWNVGRLEDALNSIQNAIELCPNDESNMNIRTAILEELRKSS